MCGEELIEEYCCNCKNYDVYDGCLKSNNVYYNTEEECCDCDEYEEAPDLYDEWCKYN